MRGIYADYIYAGFGQGRYPVQGIMGYAYGRAYPQPAKFIFAGIRAGLSFSGYLYT